MSDDRNGLLSGDANTPTASPATRPDDIHFLRVSLGNSLHAKIVTQSGIVLNQTSHSGSPAKLGISLGI
jgi:hypothetical protein